MQCVSVTMECVSTVNIMLSCARRRALPTMDAQKIFCWINKYGVNDVLAHIMFLESFSGFSLCRILSLCAKCDDQVSPIRAALLWITAINSGEYF